jgi:hypothetical protein
MPWWSWFAIWAVLALALVAMFVLLAVWLFRKVMALFTDLETLSAKLEILDTVSAPVVESVVPLAVLQRWVDVAARRDEARSEWRDRRDSRHDARVERGRALTRVDVNKVANKRSWFS